MNDPHRRNILNMVRELVEADRLDEAMEQLKALPDYQNDASEFKNKWNNLQDRSRKGLIRDEEFQTQKNNWVHNILGLISEEASNRLNQSLHSLKTNSHSTPFFLPQTDIATFVGREEELRKLHNVLLDAQGSRIAGIVGLTGAGGMGKTSLAFHFAELYKDRFPDGVIGLRVDNDDIDATAYRFAYHAGVKIDSEQKLSAAEIMQSSFRNKRMLLIFDNAEEATARALNPGGDQCAVIVTTRNRHVLSSFSILSDAQIDLRGFQPEESIRLLTQILGEIRINREPEAAAQLHLLVGGLPLAVQIVGSSLSDQKFTTLKDYVTILEDTKARLSYLYDPDDPDFNVRACFSLSLRYLNDAQIDLFACLSVCTPEGFGLQTVKAIAGQADPLVSSGVGRLLRLSLLNEGTREDRFIFHPLLFLFVRELAESRNLLEDAEERHTKYFIGFVQDHRSYSPANFDALDVELNSLLLTVQRLCNSPNPNYDFWLNLEPFFQSRGYWVQALKIIETFYEVARAKRDYYPMTQLLLHRGQFLHLFGRFNEAEQVLKEAIKFTRHIEGPSQQRLYSMLLNSLGGVYQRQGRFDDAIRTFQQSEGIGKDIGNQRGRAMVLTSLGGVYQRQGKFDDAIRAFQQSERIEQQLGNSHGHAMVLTSLGGVYQRQGKLDEAILAFEHAYELLVDTGDRRGQAMVLHSLGGVYQRQRKFDDAILAFEQSLKMREDDKLGQAMVLTSLGGVYQRQGRYDDAIRVLRQGETIEQEIGNQRGRAMVLNSLGVVFLRQGKYEEAISALQLSYDLAVETDDEWHKAMVLNSLGNVYQRQGKYDDAIRTYEQSLDMREDDKVGQAMVLNSLGGVYQRLGKWNEAIRDFQKSYDLWLFIGDKRGQAMALSSLGEVYQKQGDLDKAIQSFQKCVNMGQHLNDKSKLARVYGEYGKVLLQKGNLAEAVEKLDIAFGMNEREKNRRDIAIVTPFIYRTLMQLGKTERAETYYKRALAIAPNSQELLRLKQDLAGKSTSANSANVKAGRIKRIFYESNGYIYGFITQDDGEEDIYFNERQVGQELLATITEGMAVMVEAESSPKGLRARRLWQKKT